MVPLFRRHMNHQRPSKRHGVPIVRPFLGFSSFARTILFSRSAPAYSHSAFTESPGFVTSSLSVFSISSSNIISFSKTPFLS